MARLVREHEGAGLLVERVRGVPAEFIKEHDKKVGLLTKQEVRGVNYLKMEKNRMEMESLESKMLVATQSIDTTTSEIIRLRESELFPQLLELVAGTTWICMVKK
ncbi:protein ALTERED PHOSPHATE STARVATION RESPONSE 1-like isoform X1 [Triticum dicoccoides]|uniref:protein ALTERED PHOSPHATE STARVATION RESPONSE 1-like isoform X1 n=1 Tax=Triticum dicoccoides TaxID=85692 RepID=UPI001890BE1A|nr:protein ALTERED PHOSPHATE STARVATION RESPONSE 1-like isoform X1 [Triticum dicoccoides]